MGGYVGLLMAAIRGLLTSRQDLVLENLALRHQLAMCGRRPRVRDGDRLLWVTLLRRWTGWRSALVVLKPDTVVRWHREGWRRYWRWKSRQKRGGRRKIAQEARELITRIARENPRWGAVRIRGELLALGHDVSAASVRRYRRQALRRPPSQRWQTASRTTATTSGWWTFSTVPTLLFQTLYVFVVVSHDRRRIEHVNVTAHPTAAWVWQQVIEATPWQRYYPMRGFGNFASASGFCTAFDELNDYLMMRQRGERRPSLSDQRHRLFTERWQTLMVELAAAA